MITKRTYHMSAGSSSMPIPMTTSTPAVDIPPRLTFETAAAHATAQVPIADPTARARDVRAEMTSSIVRKRKSSCCLPRRAIRRHRHDRTSTQSVWRVDCRVAHGSRRTVRRARSRPGTGCVARRSPRRVGARRGRSDRRFVGVIPPYRLLAVLLAEHEEDLSRLGGFLKEHGRCARHE